MEHLDKLIPLAILGLIGVVAVFLIRRVARERDAAMHPGDQPIHVEAQPVKTAEPVAVVPEPIPVAAASEPAAAVTVGNRRKRAPTPVAAPTPPTPVVNVMDLLQNKDALAAAFLLREILAPPVSKR